MKLSKREAGIMNFINRTISTVLTKGAARVKCATPEVRKELLLQANHHGIMTICDGLDVILAKKKQQV